MDALQLMNEWCIYIALYCVSPNTQSAFQPPAANDEDIGIIILNGNNISQYYCIFDLAW